MKTRLASKLDASVWWGLWLKFLEEHDKYSTDKLGPKAKAYWESYFFSYATGGLDGVVLLGYSDAGEPISVLMGGELLSKPGVPSKLGRVAYLHGMWTEPAYRKAGHGMAIGLEFMKHCQARGFDTIVTTVYNGNPGPLTGAEAINAQAFGVLYSKSLRG